MELMYDEILAAIHEEARPYAQQGNVASYIPALREVDPFRFGMAIRTLDGHDHETGDVGVAFSIQSISKVFSLALAYSLVGDELWRRVGVEPSGNPFNSLVQLEYEKGIPRNPFINAGALVVTDVLMEQYTDPKAALLAFVRKLAGDDAIAYSETIARSEKETGYTNVALVNFLRSHHNITHDVDAVLDVYFYQCAIMMTCSQLARAMVFLANHGALPNTGETILSTTQAKRINALMLMCGFYDQAGEFAYRVGLPGKSGVGGGVAAVIPHKLAVSVWSPPLNEQGNSVAGIRALELLTTQTGYSVF